VAAPVSKRPTPRTILFAGLLRESKGVLVLLEALAALRERGCDVMATVAGAWSSETFQRHVAAEVRRLGLEERVAFTGALGGEEYLRLFDQAYAFCFPTYYESESFSVVIIEAMRAGLPVVATEWRGLPGLVHEGETGFLVPTHDAAAVADRLQALLARPSLADAMGAAGRRAFESDYRLQRYLDRITAVLAGVASTPKREDASR
jgi:glycosyltransferase involved in cell wall biosynthesis